MNFEILKQSITEIIGDKTINSNEKESGVVYTPPCIVMHMITELDIKKGETIIEPSVGHGMFVFHLIQYFVSKFNFAQVLELKSYVKKHVFGVDTNEEAISYLNETLAAFFRDNGVATTSDEFSNNFFVADGLFDVRETDYDIAIGNPPYVRVQNLEKEYLSRLREEYSTCKKKAMSISTTLL